MKYTYLLPTIINSIFFAVWMAIGMWLETNEQFYFLAIYMLVQLYAFSLVGQHKADKQLEQEQKHLDELIKKVDEPKKLSAQDQAHIDALEQLQDTPLNEVDSTIISVLKNQIKGDKQ